MPLTFSASLKAARFRVHFLPQGRTTPPVPKRCRLGDTARCTSRIFRAPQLRSSRNGASAKKHLCHRPELLLRPRGAYLLFGVHFLLEASFGRLKLPSLRQNNSAKPERRTNGAFGQENYAFLGGGRISLQMSAADTYNAVCVFSLPKLFSAFQCQKLRLVLAHAEQQDRLRGKFVHMALRRGGREKSFVTT